MQFISGDLQRQLLCRSRAGAGAEIKRCEAQLKLLAARADGQADHLWAESLLAERQQQGVPLANT
jgi:hypothetical protein